MVEARAAMVSRVPLVLKGARYKTPAALGVNDGGKDARRESGNAKFPPTADDLNSTCVVCMLTLPFLVSLLFFFV